MRAGALRDRVTIQQPTTVTDTQGGRSVTWSTLAIVWANIRPVRTVERLQAAAIGAHFDYAVTIWHRDGVTPKMRLSWRPYKATTAKTLEIHGVTPIEREGLLLDCAEVV
jgi:SPP1 family predicted phage head-tail adaptor